MLANMAAYSPPRILHSLLNSNPLPIHSIHIRYLNITSYLNFTFFKFILISNFEFIINLIIYTLGFWGFGVLGFWGDRKSVV